VIRVSRVGDRGGETFVSPREQRDRIETACDRDGLDLREVHQELNVSGGAPLERRTGLRRAVEQIEAGEAEIVVVAYFDRLVRSLAVQHELVERIERAGGRIVAVDVGEVRADTASHWLSSTMLGMVSEYHRRVTAERTQDAKRRAVARGVPPFPNVPPGYRRNEKDGSLELHPEQASVVAEAFRMRSDGATIAAVRDHLREHGIIRSYHGVQALLGSRVVLGELTFGALSNPDSHPPIVDASTWGRVQNVRLPRGRRAKSERLLARLGVLRCGSCGSRLVVGTANHGGYPLYRCPPVGDCTRRVTVSAGLAESTTIDAVKELLDGSRGTASLEDGVAAAERMLMHAENELNAAVEAFSGLDDVLAARDRLTALRHQRDSARGRLAELQVAAVPAITISAAQDWGELTLDEQRALIVAVVARVEVRPGRGIDRITVYPRG
jgi:DNA invertase Pin-like site-specific DNA recombinase